MEGNEGSGTSDLATWMSASEVADLAGVTARSVRRACDEGRLEHIEKRSGRDRYLIEPSIAEAWIRSRSRQDWRPLDAHPSGDDTSLLLELAMARSRIAELELENAANMLTAERERNTLEVQLTEARTRLEHAQASERRWRRVVASLSSEELTQADGLDR